MAVGQVVAERVLMVLERVVGTDEVRRNLDIKVFDEGILDSLGTVELIVDLSEEFQIEIRPAHVDREEWSTPRRIIQYVENIVGN